MTDDQEKADIMNFLHEQVFDPILNDPKASPRLKRGIQLTIARMNQRNAEGMIRYYWSAISGTTRSVKFAEAMRAEGFTRFEDPKVLEQFRVRFPLHNHVF